MKLSFVIPAYNEEMYIGGCLDSIFLYAAARHHEIVVVDNGSTDKTAEIAKLRPGVQVVSEARCGITFARQRGLEVATGDLIAFIDADTRLTPTWVEIAEQSFKNDSELVFLSGPYRYYDGPAVKRFLTNAISIGVLPIGYALFGYMLVGGNYIARKKSLLETGGFDTHIDFFGEDTDIGRRLHAQGRSCFRLDFFIFSSARRFYAEGMLRANTVYLLNYLWVVFFHRPLSKTHHNIRALYPSDGPRQAGLFLRSLLRICSHFSVAIFRTLSRKKGPLTPSTTTIVTAADTSE